MPQETPLEPAPLEPAPTVPLGHDPLGHEALDYDAAVRDRYAAAARTPEAALCCPTRYAPEFLRALPDEIVAKDYGCGDPSQWVQAGETVVDLGSGAGKICYILAQKVGTSGRVVGIDVNDEMLALARRYERTMAERLGYANVSFRKARIQDLGLDLEQLDGWLQRHPVRDLAGLEAMRAEEARLRRELPAVADGFADVVVSNCVLNLVRPEDKVALFADMFRVLKRGGRAVISDIVCDEAPTVAMQNDPALWSGCVSGAFLEDQFLAAFLAAGFHGVEILERAVHPWQVVDGIEFRSVTVQAWKGKQGPCLERNQAVIYRGPWSSVQDDDGHTFRRGERTAVCDKTYRLLTAAHGPYGGEFEPVPPRREVPLAEAAEFACRGTFVRDPKVTKGGGVPSPQAAGPGEGCVAPGCC